MASMSGETLRQQVDGIWLQTKHLLGSLRKRTVYLCGYTVGTRTRSRSAVFSGALIFLKHWNYLTGQLFVGQVEVAQLFMGLISPMDWQFQVAMTGVGERRSFMQQSTALLSKNLVAVISGARMVETTGRETEQSFYCFNRRAFGDLVVEDASGTSPHGNHKILGSAQRRLSGVVLQHGSLLLHRNPHIQGEGSHVGLGDVLQAGSGSVNDVVDGWLQRLADRLNGELILETGPSYGKENGEIAKRTERYESVAWLHRR